MWPTNSWIIFMHFLEYWLKSVLYTVGIFSIQCKIRRNRPSDTWRSTCWPPLMYGVKLKARRFLLSSSRCRYCKRRVVICENPFHLYLHSALKSSFFTTLKSIFWNLCFFSVIDRNFSDMTEKIKSIRSYNARKCTLVNTEYCCGEL